MPHLRQTTHRFRESKARRTVAENARPVTTAGASSAKAAAGPQWPPNGWKPAHGNAYPKAGLGRRRRRAASAPGSKAATLNPTNLDYP